MEQEPNEDPILELNVDGLEFTVYKGSVKGYVYEMQDFDHLSLIVEMSEAVHEDTQMPGKIVFVFRHSIPNFDEVLEVLEEQEQDIASKEKPSEFETQMYMLSRVEGNKPVYLEYEAETDEYNISTICAEDKKGLEVPEQQKGSSHDEDLPIYGATKEAKIGNTAAFMAWEAEQLANGRTFNVYED